MTDHKYKKGMKKDKLQKLGAKTGPRQKMPYKMLMERARYQKKKEEKMAAEVC